MPDYPTKTAASALAAIGPDAMKRAAAFIIIAITIALAAASLLTGTESIDVGRALEEWRTGAASAPNWTFSRAVRPGKMLNDWKMKLTVPRRKANNSLRVGMS